MLLEMVVSSESALKKTSEPVTAGILYRLYTDIWLSKNDWSTFCTVETKLELLEHFAHSAAGQPDYQLNFAEIPGLITTWNPKLNNLDALEIDRDLRTASFLVRDGHGNYRFSHRSFQEYFLAKYLLSRATAGEYESWCKGLFKSEVYHFIRDLLPSTPSALSKLVDWIGNPSVPEVGIANAIKSVTCVRTSEASNALIAVATGKIHFNAKHFAASALGYLEPTEVEATLRLLVENEQSTVVRTNALMALARLGTSSSVKYVESMLDGKGPNSVLNGWVVFKAVSYFKRPELISAAIRSAIRYDVNAQNSRSVAECLQLCRLHWCSEAHAYCIHILGRVLSPVRAAEALILLQPTERVPFLQKIFGLIDTHPKRPQVRNLILCLRGVQKPEVENFLVKLMERHSSVDEEAAFDVLTSDYPECVDRNLENWLAKGRPHTLRFLALQRLISTDNPKTFQLVRESLNAKHPPAYRISVLRLVNEQRPAMISPLVTEIWENDPATVVKRHAMEFLLGRDRNAALPLALNKGLSDKRVGTRVAICAALGSEFSPEVTEALLFRLREDHSRWVRLQALRSLVVPGRNVARQNVFAATQMEKDPGIVALRQELLGNEN